MSVESPDESICGSVLELDHNAEIDDRKFHEVDNFSLHTVETPVSFQTVPVKSRWVAPRGLPKSKEYEQLREIARSRSGVVSAIPRGSESGLHGFTPHQQFIIAMCALFTSTFTIAYAISNLMS